MWMTYALIRSAVPLTLLCVLGIALMVLFGSTMSPAAGILGYANYPVGRIFGNLYLLDIARQVRVRIAVGIPNFAPLAWSPDGTQLAFADTDGNDYELYLLNLLQNRPDGRRARALTNNEDQDVFPAWSPDGSQLVFQAFRNGRADLYVLNIEDGHEQAVVSDQDYEYAPVWSPDGALIAFASIPAERGYGLYVLNLTTLRVEYIADLQGESLSAWAPDSAHLISSPTRRTGLYRIDIGTRHPIRLNPTIHSAEGNGPPAWSTDGTQIAVISDHEGGSWIYILNVDGSDLHRVTSDAGYSSSPMWFP